MDKDAQIMLLRGALAQLVKLKNHKDSKGKDMEYITKKPLAWAMAKDALIRTDYHE